MAREGTRSQTGHAAPRVLQTVDTAPTITRKKSTKPKSAPEAPAAKPAGVTKKKPAKKAAGPATKTKATVNKAAKKVAGKTEPPKTTKPKAAKAAKAPPKAALKEGEPATASS